MEGLTITPETNPQELKGRLDSLGVKLSAPQLPGMIMGQEDDELKENAEKMVTLCQELSCKVCIVMTPRSDGKKIHMFGTVTEHYEQLCEKLNLVSKPLSENGIKVVIHNHLDHMSETEQEMDLLMEGTDENQVGICFDTAHAVFAGIDPVAYAKKYASRIWHLHLKDTKNTLFGRPYYFKNVFLPLGEGVVDFPTIIGGLKESGYDGGYTVELDGSFSCGDPEKEAATSLAYLNKIL